MCEADFPTISTKSIDGQFFLMFFCILSKDLTNCRHKCKNFVRLGVTTVTFADTHYIDPVIQIIP